MTFDIDNHTYYSLLQYEYASAYVHILIANSCGSPAPHPYRACHDSSMCANEGEEDDWRHCVLFHWYGIAYLAALSSNSW